MAVVNSRHFAAFGEVRMSELDGPTKDRTDRNPQLPIDGGALPIIDADATLDSAGTPGSGVSRGDRAVPEPKSIGRYQLIKKLGILKGMKGDPS
jgi:hypothetical protein